LRPIASNEEVTMDYSATEADLNWQMSCACQAPGCRKNLTSIQTAFAGATQPPAALPAMQDIWRQAQAQANDNRAKKRRAPNASQPLSTSNPVQVG
jgi:hypothetical protein